VTKFLQNLYASKPLYILPSSHVSSKSYPALQSSLRTAHPTKTFTIPVSAFSELSSKSNTITLRDIYLKMVVRIRVVSGEKAIEIQKVWRTPREFVEAYEMAGDETRKERM